MPSADEVIRQVREAFGGNEYPGDRWLQGSSEGCEPAEEVGPFVGRQRWEDVPSSVLDGHYAALSFFSEAAFRFFLPAFLIGDLRNELQTADPLNHLTGGFCEGSVEVPAGGRPFVRRFGGSVLVNPRRYGASRFVDYARFRMSVFTREEAAAIVSYLEFKRDQEEIPLLRGHIETALSGFWRERAASAPPAASLRAHLEEDAEYVAALQRQQQQRDDS